MAELACAIARELGWNEARLESLRIAAVLHDLGKIVMPAEILAKPGRLSDRNAAHPPARRRRRRRRDRRLDRLRATGRRCLSKWPWQSSRTAQAPVTTRQLVRPPSSSSASKGSRSASSFPLSQDPAGGDRATGFSSSETEPASAARLSLPSVQLLSGGSTTAMISTCSVIGNRSNAFSERSTQPTSRRTRRSRANEAGSHAT